MLIEPITGKAEASFVLVGGISWMLTYAFIIKKGFQDRSYGMPMVPLALNLAWEMVFSTIYRPESGLRQGIFMTWGLLDIAILYTFLRFGYAEWRDRYGMSRTAFYGWFVAALVLSFGVMLTAVPFFAVFSYTKGDPIECAKFIANVVNTIISVSLVAMYYSRGDLKGQSISIALSKLVGNLAFNVPYASRHHEPFVLLLAGTILVFDVWYLVALWERRRAEQATGVFALAGQLG